MPLSPHPFFRKAIVPWYDSDAVCSALVILMTPVLLLGLAGVYAARLQAPYREHIWVPILLSVLSAGVIFSTVARMIRRRRPRGQSAPPF